MRLPFPSAQVSCRAVMWSVSSIARPLVVRLVVFAVLVPVGSLPLSPVVFSVSMLFPFFVPISVPSKSSSPVVLPTAMEREVTTKRNSTRRLLQIAGNKERPPRQEWTDAIKTQYSDICTVDNAKELQWRMQEMRTWHARQQCRRTRILALDEAAECERTVK